MPSEEFMSLWNHYTKSGISWNDFTKQCLEPMLSKQTIIRWLKEIQLYLIMENKPELKNYLQDVNREINRYIPVENQFPAFYRASISMPEKSYVFKVEDPQITYSCEDYVSSPCIKRKPSFDIDITNSIPDAPSEIKRFGYE
jgi:hypothetical protein